MGVRVLGGNLKGMELDIPSSVTRPTSVMIRRKIFDRRQDYINTVFIDCCAGSGSMGIEAWSRNADCVYFLEKNPSVLKILKKNVSRIKSKYPTLSFERQLLISSGDAAASLLSLKSDLRLWEKKNCEFVFYLDPPYNDKKTYDKLLLTLRSIQLDRDRIVVWIEAETGSFLNDDYLDYYGLVLDKKLTQGNRSVYLGSYREE
ncbi:RsmD family RNA methyltransferase [Bacteriovoracaceae bacterium]|nr:RsmD family RNA methyltransferase [Bacteriovoracaceae bacterium]